MRRNVQLLSAAALAALATSAGTHASTASPWCSAHVLLGANAANLTFTCTAAVTRLRLEVPANAELTARPRLLLSGRRSSACTLSGRTVTCAGKVAPGKSAGVVLRYRPIAKLGDAILFDATAHDAPIVLRLSVADPND